jgi:hypothetical protein
MMLVSQRMIRNDTGKSTAQFKILKSHARSHSIARMQFLARMVGMD